MSSDDLFSIIDVAENQLLIGLGLHLRQRRGSFSSVIPKNPAVGHAIAGNLNGAIYPRPTVSKIRWVGTVPTDHLVLGGFERVTTQQGKRVPGQTPILAGAFERVGDRRAYGSSDCASPGLVLQYVYRDGQKDVKNDVMSYMIRK